jgi:hypothetical protein
MNRLPIFNIVLGDAEGIQVMSLVDYPAVESNFLAFSEQKELKFSYDDEERIVFGVALRADYPIYRNDINGEYYVNFSKDVIKKLYEKFMIDSNMNNVNLNHSEDTDKVYLIQSFLKDTEKGISPVGFEDVNDGSWFCAYKILNEDVWQKVKAGDFRGFSVEMFAELERKFEKQDEPEMDLIDEILKEI